MNTFNKIFLVTLLSLVATTFFGCTDENVFSSLQSEGKVMISIKFDLPSLEPTTRTIDSKFISSDSKGIWIGIYSATSGEYTYKGCPTRNGNTLTNITTKVGPSYIVGVANPDLFTGRTIDSTTERPLIDLLDEADTWDEFKSIIISLTEDNLSLSLSEGNIFDPFPTDNSPMPMSGFFHMGDGTPKSWDDPEVIEVKEGVSNLDGTLYFRRPWSEITFNVRPAESGSNITDLELLGAKVVNVPSYTWLFERKQETSPVGVGYANAGDALKPDFFSNENYTSAPELTTGNFICTDITSPLPPTPSRQYSFSFYMTENKRNGRADFCQSYADRERIWEETTDPVIYKSLCANEYGSLNNNATVVELRCRLTYRDGLKTNEQTSEATFRVHLGYSVLSGSSDKPSPADFNSRRNAKYTYDVEVINAEQISIKALSAELSDRYAASGNVNYTTENGVQYDLDAHYNVFPIDLTEDDIKNFNFRIESWYDGTKVVIDNTIPDKNSADWKHYSWVELVKHNDDELSKDTQIVKYPGKDSDRILHLGDIKSKGAGTYTVFINEYTYENSADESNGVNWRYYVNQPPRCLWMVVTQRSKGTSSYNRSKYYASQRSIETSYSTADDSKNVTALGIEHENECFGMNVRWTKGFRGNQHPQAYLVFNDWNLTNGRWNVWKSLDDKYEWINYVDELNIQHVNEITNTETKTHDACYQNYPYTDPRDFQVCATQLLSARYGLYNYLAFNQAGTTLTYERENFWNSTASSGSPQYATRYVNSIEGVQYFEAMYGCMNRNRDEDGDGIIDNNELKWYLPTTKEMINIVSGNNSMQSPLYDFATDNLQYPASNFENVLYHYVGSDSNYISPEFGYHIQSVSQNYPAWQIRCVRKLGTNLNEILEKEDISFPYQNGGTHIDETSMGGVVKVSDYNRNSLRNRATGALPLHHESSTMNRVCKYGFEISESMYNTSLSLKNGDDRSVKYDSYSKTVTDASSEYGVCSKLNSETGRTGWRIPNQKELIIMQMLGITGAYGSSNYFVSATLSDYNYKGKDRGGILSGDYLVCTVTGDLSPFNLDIFNPTDSHVNFNIRCVRDLTAEEAGMSYDQIKKHSSN